jgi:hypothetical protein
VSKIAQILFIIGTTTFTAHDPVLEISEAKMQRRIPLLTDELFRVIEVNARFCGMLGQLTADYLRELVMTLETPRHTTEGRGIIAAERVHYHDEAKHPITVAPPPRQATILLEAEAGHTAIGLFVIANDLDHEILAQPIALPIRDSLGTAPLPQLVFEPTTVRLAPRERMVIKVMATIDRSLQEDVSYRCEIVVPALDATRIPVVIRRRPGSVKVVEVVESQGTEKHSPASTEAGIDHAKHATSVPVAYEKEISSEAHSGQSAKRHRKSRQTTTES